MPFPYSLPPCPERGLGKHSHGRGNSHGKHPHGIGKYSLMVNSHGIGETHMLDYFWSKKKLSLHFSQLMLHACVVVVSCDFMRVLFSHILNPNPCDIVLCLVFSNYLERYL